MFVYQLCTDPVRMLSYARGVQRQCRSHLLALGIDRGLANGGGLGSALSRMTSESEAPPGPPEGRVDRGAMNTDRLAGTFAPVTLATRNSFSLVHDPPDFRVRIATKWIGEARGFFFTLYSRDRHLCACSAPCVGVTKVLHDNGTEPQLFTAEKSFQKYKEPGSKREVQVRDAVFRQAERLLAMGGRPRRKTSLVRGIRKHIYRHTRAT